MRSAIISTAFAAAAIAAPVVERQAAPGGPDDGVILNYALTLEHLENAFYKEGLAKFSQADFAAAGYDNVFYTNLKSIAADEQSHVEFLTGALSAAGVKPVVPNTYAFGFEDVKTFLTISSVLEGVGVTAYLGAAQFIADATYLTAAGSILTVEARHSSFIRGEQQPQLSPFPTPYDVPLSFNSVVTLAAPFITAIAPENGPLPVAGFPAIAAAPGAGKAGDKVKLTVAKEVDAKAAYFITITGPVDAALEKTSGTEYTITIPANPLVAGQSYVVLTKEANKVATDDNVVAGPAIIEVSDAQSGVIPDPKKCVDGKPAPYHPAPAPYHPKDQPKKDEPKHEAPKYSLTTIYNTKTYVHEAPKPTEHKATVTYVKEHKPEVTKAPVYPVEDSHKRKQSISSWKTIIFTNPSQQPPPPTASPPRPLPQHTTLLQLTRLLSVTMIDVDRSRWGFIW